MASQWVLSLSVVLLSSVAGFWMGQELHGRAQVVAALALALLTALGTLWYLRLQARRRRRTALDAYAERTLAQHISHKRRKASAGPKAPMRLARAAGPAKDSYHFPTQEGLSHARAQS
jgi:hypothetical protein